MSRNRERREKQNNTYDHVNRNDGRNDRPGHGAEFREEPYDIYQESRRPDRFEIQGVQRAQAVTQRKIGVQRVEDPRMFAKAQKLRFQRARCRSKPVSVSGTSVRAQACGWNLTDQPARRSLVVTSPSSPGPALQPPTDSKASRRNAAKAPDATNSP